MTGQGQQQAIELRTRPTREEAEAAVRQVMVDRAFGEAGDVVVIEERLTGQEVSILALVGLVGKPTPPGAVGVPYKREAK